MGERPSPAAHAIDFLNEAYQSSQFENEKTDIYNKIVDLANYLLSIQCTDDQKHAYRGFQSKDESSHYYSIDAMRAIPALLKAYNLTGTQAYLDAATLAGETFHEGLTHLSRVGLNDAFLFVRRYSQLSDGQKYRYRLAKIIESNKKYWFADEFCSTLDRDTAKIVAFNIQKIAREEGKAVFAATTHTDLFEDLKPSIHIHKRFGKEIEVHYHPNTANRECSLVKEMHITEGTKADYKKLAHFHYRDSRLFAHHKIFTMKRGDETVGAIVYGSPPLAVTGRRKAIGKNLTIKEITRDIIRISRVVIHPKYRTIGLGAKIVAETLHRAGKPIVETIAVMAKYNPFFEKAGMTKIAETKPNPQVLKVVEKLRALSFNPVFLTSERTNLNKLQNMTEKEVEKVRNAIKEVSGIYRKRVAGTKQAFLKNEEYAAIVDAADTNKLAKMLRILGFLTQTKVYLFWKKKQKPKKSTKT
jgi:GNAT superfamily N-acetyltransferase